MEDCNRDSAKSGNVHANYEMPGMLKVLFANLSCSVKVGVLLSACLAIIFSQYFLECSTEMYDKIIDVMPELIGFTIAGVSIISSLKYNNKRAMAKEHKQKMYASFAFSIIVQTITLGYTFFLNYMPNVCCRFKGVLFMLFVCFVLISLFSIIDVALHFFSLAYSTRDD